MTEMEKEELFDRIFCEVLSKMNCQWWELFDGPDFEKVENKIAKELGISLKDLSNDEDYQSWLELMFWDL